MSTQREHKVSGAACERLRAGRDGLGHKHRDRHRQVSGIQRTRLLTALAQVCVERGATNVTVAHIVERAGVSRRTFYELFSDREACFLAGLDEGLGRIASRVVPAYEQPGTWRERIRASLSELLLFLDDDPGTGLLVIATTLEVGREVLQRRGRVLAQVIDAVDEGRREARAGVEPTRLTAEGIVGGVLSVLHGRLLEGGRDSFRELVNPLMCMVVLPYLGSAAARRELDRPVSKPESRPALNGASNPLRDLEMRLTYRTVRVLMAVAAVPGASNRRVADGAGVGDQGQISKLLGRLEKLGLVANTGLGPGRGAPNAWMLTQQGEEVHGALAAQLPAA
jgi:AcrR family transcriptional regulator